MGQLIFVNRFYWPDHAATGQLLTDLARSEAARGADVLVIASRPPATQPAPDADDEGVRVIRIRSTRGAAGSIVRKATDLATFFCGALWQIQRHARRGDTLVVLTDPPLLAIPVHWIARWKQLRVVHWVQDIYPEVAVALSGRTALHLLRPLRNAAWRGADGCVTLSREMAAVVASAGVPPASNRRIPNWAPSGLQPLARSDQRVLAQRDQWGLAGKFVIAYSGNLGRVHDLEGILTAAAALRHDPRLVFVFLGSGAREEQLRSAVRERGLKNVRFIGPQPRESLSVSLGCADLHVVTLRPGCEPYVFPSKLYGVAAAGRPVLFIGPPDCELARTIRAHSLGRAVDGRAGDAVTSAIQELARDDTAYARCADAATRFSSLHSPERSLAAWHELLEAVRTC